MNSIQELVTSKTKLVNSRVTSYEELVTSSKKDKKLSPLDIQIKALTIAEGLVSINEPNDMTGWYCKRFKELGEKRYRIIVNCCKKSYVRSPERLFAKLLKEA